MSIAFAQSMKVTVDVRIGEASESPVLLFRGANGSAGSGLVGVMGVIFLTLISSRAIGGSRTQRKRFLLSWKSNIINSFSNTLYEPVFSLSETLGLRPGREGSAIIGVGVQLLAFRAGVDDPRGGFSGVDFRGSGTSPLWWGGPRGPIRIPEISVVFCPQEHLPIDQIPL